jgi:hypothetical protein
VLRRLIATALTLSAVVVVALALAVSRHQPTATSAAQTPTVVLVRTDDGKLTPVVVPSQTQTTTHATTRTS